MGSRLSLLGTLHRAVVATVDYPKRRESDEPDRGGGRSQKANLTIDYSETRLHENILSRLLAFEQPYYNILLSVVSSTRTAIFRRFFFRKKIEIT